MMYSVTPLPKTFSWLPLLLKAQTKFTAMSYEIPGLSGNHYLLILFSMTLPNTSHQPTGHFLYCTMHPPTSRLLICSLLCLEYLTQDFGQMPPSQWSLFWSLYWKNLSPNHSIPSFWMLKLLPGKCMHVCIYNIFLVFASTRFYAPWGWGICFICYIPEQRTKLRIL